jgi:two-component system phosphate regulon response regulator OmpR
MLAGDFEKNGFVVTAFADAEEMLQSVGRQRPDLMVMDVGLPGISGLRACQRLRAQGDHVPIILLPARSEEVDRVLGLEMGADDYVAKPFSSRELLARVRALLRRAAVRAAAGGVRTTIRIGEIIFAPESRSLHRGREVRVLSAVEHALLAELAGHPSTPLSRERLLSVSHGHGDTVLLRTIDAAILRLRRILEPDPAAPRYIQTVRNQGYMFVPHDTSCP